MRPDECDAIIERLRAAPLFARIDTDALRALAYLMKRVTLDDGDVLFTPGDVAADAFVVLEGEAELESAGGSEEARACMRQGELFGEVALFGGGRRAATARARGKLVAGVVGYEPLVELLRAWPDLSLALLRRAATRFLAVEDRGIWQA